MIVNIERYEKDQDFWMIDGIRKISSSSYLLTRIELKERQDEVSILDYWNNSDNKVCTCKDSDECSNCLACKRLICRDDEGNEFSILFDTIAYILNDKGRTVEKVVANYND